MSSNGLKGSGVSFKFSKTSEKKTITHVNLATSPKDEDKKDFITDFDKNVNKQKVGKPKYIIPMVTGDDDNSKMDSLTTEAIQELIRDASNIDVIEKSRPRISLLNMTRITADDVDENDYEKIPIEEFGKAMLRGMGWKDEETKKDEENKISLKSRNTARILGLSEFDRDNKTEQEDRVEDEELVLNKGAFCFFVSGFHKGRYGRVREDQGERVIVEMSSSGEVVNTSPLCLKIVTEKEFNRKKKYLNNSKVEEYMRDQAEKQLAGKVKHEHGNDRDEHKDLDRKKDKKTRRETTGDREMERGRDREDGKGSKRKIERVKEEVRDDRIKEETRNIPIKEIQRKYHHHHTNDFSKSEHTGNKGCTKKLSWLHPNLVVRIVDKKLKNGKYFKEKVVIEDVTKPRVCNCRTTANEYLEDLQQDQLETVIPREAQSIVMVVNGEHKFQKATVLHQDRKDSKIIVNLLGDHCDPLTLDFDDVCQVVDSYS